VRFSLTTADAGNLARFYAEAFGCEQLASERLDAAECENVMGVRGGATCIRLALGKEAIELVQFDTPGEPYPRASTASDPVFQHFAIVVSDVAAAYRHLGEIAGWAGITRDGPQRLPDSSGGVTAFKFRDPEGHPLELLGFPPERTPVKWRDPRPERLWLGIDHSAIAVSDTARSIAFYEVLGLRPTARSLNRGPEQERLDDISEAVVEVTALSPPSPDPHLELLCYRHAPAGRAAPVQMNDIAATRLVFEGNQLDERRGLVDPDGHHLVLMPAAR
jgi:catechol 2,3-dioxygenase-like lactoylglutathione lyase family enzyme